MRGIAMAIVGATWLWHFRETYEQLPDDVKKFSKQDNAAVGSAVAWFAATFFTILMGW